MSDQHTGVFDLTALAGVSTPIALDGETLGAFRRPGSISVTDMGRLMRLSKALEAGMDDLQAVDDRLPDAGEKAASITDRLNSINSQILSLCTTIEPADYDKVGSILVMAILLEFTDRIPKAKIPQAQAQVARQRNKRTGS